jgi:hypothetical protein
MSGSGRINYIGYAMIFFISAISLKIYLESDTFNLKCIISNKDGKTYCVRERANMEASADLLAHATDNMSTLVKYVGEKYPDRENVQRLVNGYKPDVIKETLPTSKFTAYSENKGEKLAFCLNKKKGGSELIDVNTLTFVAIHELSHIMTASIGHKKEFWLNFKFLLQNAKEINVINIVNYKKHRQEYCGMKISDNPYYDI